jgi:hypothetical protein
LRSASASELSLKVLSPEREIILPDLKDPGSLSVQLETARLNLVENLGQMVLKLCEDVQQLQKNN